MSEKAALTRSAQVGMFLIVSAILAGIRDKARLAIPNEECDRIFSFDGEKGRIYVADFTKFY